MKTINLERRIGIVSIILTLVAIIGFALAFTSCKKLDGLKPPKDDGKLVEVTFSPTLNGEVVPMNFTNKLKGTKGDGTFTFTHRYTDHFIRIKNGEVWVADIPLTGLNSYSYKLPKGIYTVQVLPTVDVVDIIRFAAGVVSPEWIPYAPLNIGADALNKVYDKASFESNAVGFTIANSSPQIVNIKVFTRMALMLLDLGDDPSWEYSVLGIGIPKLQFVTNPTYLESTSLVFPYNQTFDELEADPARLMADVNIDATNRQYFDYFVPGLKTSYNVPNVNVFTPIAKSTYLRFGEIGYPGTMPSIWLRDYWNDGTLKANMCIRVKYSVGTLTFTTERLTWFGETINIIDGTVPPAESPLTISVAQTMDGGNPVHGSLTATIAGGTDPKTVTWWLNALCTTPALNQGIPVIGVIGSPLQGVQTWGKVTDTHGHFTISNPVTPVNTDIQAPTVVNNGTSFTATGHAGFSPYTFVWYNAISGGSVLGTGDTYFHNNVVGSYYVECTDAVGQKSGRVLAGTITPPPAITFDLPTYSGTPTGMTLLGTSGTTGQSQFVLSMTIVTWAGGSTRYAECTIYEDGVEVANTGTSTFAINTYLNGETSRTFNTAGSDFTRLNGWTGVFAAGKTYHVVIVKL